MSRNQARRSRDQRQQQASRTMMLVFAAVFFIGMFLQIAMVARLMHQNKQIEALEAEITDWNARTQNLELALSQFKRLDRVTEGAARLGMEEPTEEQIRVINVPDIVEDTSAQSAVSGAGE